MTPIKCFLIVPIYGTARADDHNSWVPKTIIGWERQDTGERRDHNADFGVGAMWHMVWLWKNSYWENETEPPLCVRCPNGPVDASGRQPTCDWVIDSRCSNCGLPDDKLHRCWVRHGEPPNITVDKNGVTCNAGGGSIGLTHWHGFLKNGELVE